MLHGKKVVVVLPAYKAERTLRQTYNDIPRDLVDAILLVDDASNDKTAALACELGIQTFVHERNLGYGANQKTCYAEALRAGADIVVMVHPDYQYDPRLISAMAAMIASGIYDVVLASRILRNTALRGGMPFYKYVANRTLTLFQNLMLGTKLSEFHTGYRAFSRKALESLPLLANSDDFVFDNQLLTQAVAMQLSIGEISCPTKYFPAASSINFSRSVRYGFGVVGTTLLYKLWQLGLYQSEIFATYPTLRISANYYSGIKVAKREQGSRLVPAQPARVRKNDEEAQTVRRA
jgi:glycosyltransferase involved in cell wall biosynthesis